SLLANVDAPTAASAPDDPWFDAWIERTSSSLAERHLSLPQDVRRDGHVRTGRTHVDVFLSLQTADALIRREALDLDPGLVPWLDRVVLFHYVSQAQLSLIL